MPQRHKHKHTKDEVKTLMTPEASIVVSHEDLQALMLIGALVFQSTKVLVLLRGIDTLEGSTSRRKRVPGACLGGDILSLALLCLLCSPTVIK